MIIETMENFVFLSSTTIQDGISESVIASVNNLTVFQNFRGLFKFIDVSERKKADS